MSDHVLPDDVRQWPHDPFELLGVKPNVDETELKRAYHRLLRQYRPDRTPDEFRRIREAYDSARAYASWQATVADDTTSPDAEPSHAEKPTSHEPCSPLPPSFEDRLRGVGEALRSGDRAVAYARLTQLSAEHPMRVEPYLGAYWLLRFEPTLDATRTADEWLQAGLQASPDDEPLVQAYLADFERRPADALQADVAEFAFTRLSASNGVRFFQMRWQTAARLSSYAVVGRDLEALQASSWWLDRHVWLTFMQTALEAVDWSVDPEAIEAAAWCRREIRTYPNIHASQFEALARLDHLEEAADSVRAFFGLDFPRSALGRLLSYGSQSDPATAYVDLLTLADECNHDASSLLRRLENLHNPDHGLLSRLHGVVVGIAWTVDGDEAEPWNTETLCDPVCEFFHRAWSSYSQLRPALVEWCLEWGASPGEVAQALTHATVFTEGFIGEMHGRLGQDAPLHCAYALLCVARS